MKWIKDWLAGYVRKNALLLAAHLANKEFVKDIVRTSLTAAGWSKQDDGKWRSPSDSSQPGHTFNVVVSEAEAVRRHWIS